MRSIISARLAGQLRARLCRFIRASFGVWVFGDFQNTGFGPDEQLHLLKNVLSLDS
jgi:hypothetical protein